MRPHETYPLSGPPFRALLPVPCPASIVPALHRSPAPGLQGAVRPVRPLAGGGSAASPGAAPPVRDALARLSEVAARVRWSPVALLAFVAVHHAWCARSDRAQEGEVLTAAPSGQVGRASHVGPFGKFRRRPEAPSGRPRPAAVEPALADMAPCGAACPTSRMTCYKGPEKCVPRCRFRG